MDRAPHWDLKRGPWTDEPRYHRPGQHPALEQTRRMLAAIRDHQRQALRDEQFAIVPVVDVSLADQAIAHHEQQIADFEGRESEAKARDYYMLKGR